MTNVAPIIALQTGIYAQCDSTRGPATSVMPWLLDPRNIEAAWERVRTADGANTPGPDGLTADELNGRGVRWCEGWVENVRLGRYRPSPPRWVELQKPGTGKAPRRIGILSLADRVLHTAIRLVLEPILDPRMSPNSFGYRPGRSVPAAVQAVSNTLTEAGPRTYRLAVRLDVADCFDTIDHEILLSKIAHHVADQEFLGLMTSILRSGGHSSGRLWRRRPCGIVQGSPLSPLLCNLYLDSLDRLVERISTETLHSVRGYRYADDLLLLARDRRSARRTAAAMRRHLRSLHQRLNSAKSRVFRVDGGFEWLGLRIHPLSLGWRNRTEFVHSIPDERVLAMLDRVRELTTPPSSRLDADVFDLGRWIVSINDQLRDWRQAYLYANNAQSVFTEIDALARDRVAELIHAVTGLHRAAIHRRYHQRLPRGFWTWQVDGARLIALASLPPHYPARLIRRPPWHRTANACAGSPTDRAVPSKGEVIVQPPIDAPREGAVS